MIFGLTHDDQGKPIQRATINYKVSIGLPPAEGSNFPKRLDHFYVAAKNGKGDWVQDAAFTQQLTEKYGKREGDKPPQPIREFDVILLSDETEEVFRTELAWWTKAELKCHGNGRDAMRRASVLQQMNVPHEAGKTWAPWQPCGDGCKEYDSGICKPSGNLYFMFADKPVIGSVSFYHTSGFEGVRRMVSSLEAIRSVTGGRLRGIRLKMVLRPYKARYTENGVPKTSAQYAANLEFREEDHHNLVPRLIEQSLTYQKQISAAVEIEPLDEALEAETIAPEFYPPQGERPEEPAAAPDGTTTRRPKALESVVQQVQAPAAQPEPPKETVLAGVQPIDNSDLI